MRPLFEGLALRLAREQPSSRRELLRGRAGSGVHMPSPTVAATAPAAVVLAAPALAAADPPSARPSDMAQARSAEPPAPPSRPDLREIHLAVIHTVGRLDSELIAVITAMSTPESNHTFSPAAHQAVQRLLTTVGELRTQVAAVKRQSAPRSEILKFLDHVAEMLDNLERMGSSTSATEVANLNAVMAAEARIAQAAYDAARHPLNLPPSYQRVTS